MSRIGKKPITIPKGVTIKVDGAAVDVKGPKGQLNQALPPGVTAAVEDGTLVTRKTSDDRELDKFHGLARSLVNNANLNGQFVSQDLFASMRAVSSEKARWCCWVP